MAANRAMQLKGGAGYMKDEPYEQILRDIRIFPIFEGANDVMRAFIALSGMKPVGEKLEGLGDIGLGDPIGSIGILLDFASDRVRQQVRPDRITQAHPELESHADAISDHVRRSIAFFTADLFAARAGQGCAAPDPIFILGMPRAGSTLVEQILASHPEVEGTMELPDIPELAKRLGGRKARGEVSAYPECLAALDRAGLAGLGEDYLETTRIQRKTAAPIFIDKMPNNFAHVGFIHLMLPNAKIVDARRHPLGCCFSGFKQHFARGQGFTYDLAELGRYYRDYVELMAHFDDALPGRVHRVVYERMVEDTEAEVRRLLDYCGLPFEEGCLRFYENDRPVRTASSEQVRRPIYKEGVDQWRHYEPWLDPLKAALGPVLEAYPEAP